MSVDAGAKYGKDTLGKDIRDFGFFRDIRITLTNSNSVASEEIMRLYTRLTKH